MKDNRAEDILTFWLEEKGPQSWYAVDADLDREIRDRYLELWKSAAAGELDLWKCCARTMLALIVLLDQFPRNMFRGEPHAFASDPLALRCAKLAREREYDLEFEMPARQFFYLPFMHSEFRLDQDRSVRLFCLTEGGENSLRHAIAHRSIIRDFGRFPYRNEALGRSTTDGEAAFLADGGYKLALHRVPAL